MTWATNFFLDFWAKESSFHWFGSRMLIPAKCKNPESAGMGSLIPSRGTKWRKWGCFLESTVYQTHIITWVFGWHMVLVLEPSFDFFTLNLLLYATSSVLFCVSIPCAIFCLVCIERACLFTLIAYLRCLSRLYIHVTLLNLIAYPFE